MIVARVRGGLGNQLFQFAAATALARHHGVECKLDLYYYKKHPYRKFELEKFNAPISLATRQEIHQFTGKNPVQRFLNKYENFFHCPKVCAQPHYHFFEDFFNLPSDIYLSGYWQSEQYFSKITNHLREWYSPKNPLDVQNQELRDKIREGNSVCLHVRRGDYTGNSTFGFVPVEYYKKAIDTVMKDVSNPQFFVFSDDIPWCKENIKIPNATFVEHNKGDDSFKDLVLMSYCKHNIIANSTFSWWGAWLNSNPSKIVIAPQVWFATPYNAGKNAVYPSRIYNTKDLIPKTWLRL
jgi:hypothetical protein